MRPLSYRSDALRALLLRNQIATFDEMKQALGNPVDVTVFRKLKPLDYLSSYSHRGRYYTLREIARFDDHGLWSQADVWFSRSGTLLATAEVFVNRSPRGFFADELARALHVEVQDALHQLTQQRRVTREVVSGLYLYAATARDIQRGQLLTRRTVEAVPTVPDASVLAVSEDELKASILLFYSLLDEQQRRLYAGLESLKLGRGGDHQLADFLDLDPHTVARGRQQLLTQDVEVERARRTGGGGRKRTGGSTHEHHTPKPPPPTPPGRSAAFLALDPHTVARGRQQLLAQDVEVDRPRRTGGGRKPGETKSLQMTTGVGKVAGGG